jgi:hypothetical protein
MIQPKLQIEFGSSIARIPGVAHVGVGFLKVSDDNKDADPIGAGTFARLGKTTGIHPCHVLESLP